MALLDGSPKMSIMIHTYHTMAAKYSNTTNLHSHLKHRHPVEYSVVQYASERGVRKTKMPDLNQPSLANT